MEQVNEKMREITEFLRNLNFKKKGGGVDKEDVLDKIEQLTIMYHMILEEQSDTIEALQAQNRALAEQAAQAAQPIPAPMPVSDNRIMEMGEQMNRLHAALSEAQRARQEAEEKAAELRVAMERQQANLERQQAAMERQQVAMNQLQEERAAAPVMPVVPAAPAAPVAPPPPSPDKEEVARQEFYLQALRRELAALEERRAELERNLMSEVRALESIRKMREENQKAAQAEKSQLREGLRGLREECVRVLSIVSEFDSEEEKEMP